MWACVGLQGLLKLEVAMLHASSVFNRSALHGSGRLEGSDVLLMLVIQVGGNVAYCYLRVHTINGW
jgi:hypothetical protein